MQNMIVKLAIHALLFFAYVYLCVNYISVVHTSTGKQSFGGTLQPCV